MCQKLMKFDRNCRLRPGPQWGISDPHTPWIRLSPTGLQHKYHPDDTWCWPILALSNGSKCWTVRNFHSWCTDVIQNTAIQIWTAKLHVDTSRVREACIQTLLQCWRAGHRSVQTTITSSKVSKYETKDAVSVRIDNPARQTFSGRCCIRQCRHIRIYMYMYTKNT